VQTRKTELEMRNLRLQAMVRQRKLKVYALVLTLQNCIQEEEKDKKFLAFVESKLDQQLIMAYESLLKHQPLYEVESNNNKSRDTTIKHMIVDEPSRVTTSSQTAHLYNLLGLPTHEPTVDPESSESEYEHIEPPNANASTISEPNNVPRRRTLRTLSNQDSIELPIPSRNPRVPRPVSMDGLTTTPPGTPNTVQVVSNVGSSPPKSPLLSSLSNPTITSPLSTSGSGGLALTLHSSDTADGKKREAFKSRPAKQFKPRTKTNIV